MKSSPRVPAVSIASVLLILLLNTCGIERFIRLNPPSNPEKWGDYLVSFTKTTENSETEFIGFDLYYKFYANLDDPSSDLDDILEFEDLEANDFRRIHASDDKQGSPPPLVYIQPNDRTPGASPPDNDEFTLSAYLSGAPTDLVLTEPVEYPIVVDDGNSNLIDGGDSPLTGPEPILIEITDIRRGVYDDSNDSYKQFSDFSEGDSDISYNEDIWSDIFAGNQIKIVIYAVSYGYDLINFRPLHSEPVRLGIIDRKFPLSE